MGVLLSILKNLFLGISPTAASKKTETNMKDDSEPDNISSDSRSDITTFENSDNVSNSWETVEGRIHPDWIYITTEAIDEANQESDEVDSIGKYEEQVYEKTVGESKESNLSESISKSDLDLVSSCANEVFDSKDETEDFIYKMSKKLEEIDSQPIKEEPQSPVNDDDLNLVKSCAENIFNDEIKTNDFMSDLNSKLSKIKNQFSDNVFDLEKTNVPDDNDDSNLNSNVEKYDFPLDFPDEDVRLNTINKTRIKAPSKRRPPSRRFLKNIQQQNDIGLHNNDDFDVEEVENSESKTEDRMLKVTETNVNQITPNVDKNAFMADLNKRLSMRKVIC